MKLSNWIIAVVGTASAVAQASGELPAGATVHVAPLTQAMWNQGRHYNRMCPTTDSSKCPDGRMWAGCTAVATAILMKYYEWPKQGETWYQNLNDEKAWANDYNSVSLRARFDEPYKWEKMQDVYGYVTSSESSMAIGQLLSDIGAVMNMNYGESGSSTLRDNVSGVLEHNFHFDASDLYQVDDDFTPEVETRIQDQLRAGHPIVSAGQAGKSGHTYICDGFAQTSPENAVVTNLYHFNFGWGGTSNGWYPLDAILTASTPGEAMAYYPVQSMLLGVLPQKAPLILGSHDVTGPAVDLEWDVAKCWTNDLTGFRIERQDPTQTIVNEDMTDKWSVRSEGWGWKMSGGVPVAYSKNWWSGNWPTAGVNAGTSKPVAVSANSKVTIVYKAKKFPAGVKLELIKSDADGMGWSDSNEDYPVLATLSGGSSATTYQTFTNTVNGTKLNSVFGYDPAYFALKFTDANSDRTYYYETEVFELVSFSVSGEGTAWMTQSSVELPAAARNHAMANQPVGDHRYRVVAKYGATEQASAVIKTICATAPTLPEIELTSVAGNKLTYTVKSTTDFTYEFVTQSNAARGTAERPDASTVTFTLANDIETVGTHWITLYVTDASTGAKAKKVYYTNPTPMHPLEGSYEPTVAAASARARREGKLVLTMVTGDPDSEKFVSMGGILTSNDLVNVIREKFVLTEVLTCVPGLYEVGASYWREQPQGYGQDKTTYAPETTGYAVVVNPSNPKAPYPCDALPDYYFNAASRWNYFNSQYDLTNLMQAFYVAKGAREMVTFLNQEKFAFPEPTEPDPVEPEPVEPPDVPDSDPDPEATVEMTPSAIFGNMLNTTFVNAGALPEKWTARSPRVALPGLDFGSNGAVVNAGWKQNRLDAPVEIVPAKKAYVDVETYASAKDVNAVIYLTSPGYSVCLGNSYNSNPKVYVGGFDGTATNVFVSFQQNTGTNPAVAQTVEDVDVSKSLTYHLVIDGPNLVGTVTDGATTNRIGMLLPETYAFDRIGAALDGVAGSVGLKRMVVSVVEPPVVEPTIDAGELVGTIEKVGDEYVVSPAEGTTCVSISNAGSHVIVVPPCLRNLLGVSPSQVKVREKGYDVTSAFQFLGDKEKGYAMTLEENAMVTIGAETIRVVPEFAPDAAHETTKSAPFVMTSGIVAVGVRTIPGLTYELVCYETLPDADGKHTVVAAKRADSLRMELKDPNPRAGQAFYRVRVSP